MSAITTSASDYDVIEVPAGEMHTVNLGDGETYENKLIDISASGAEFQIRARANDWTIRNIGVRGHWERETSSFHAMILEVPDENSEGLVENVHFDTTTASDADYGSGPGGPYVFPGHAGHITFDRIYLQHFQDNGIYASPPGLPDKGKGGTVTIKNSYAYRCGTSNFRLGTTGSKLENCVSINAHRGFWAQLNHPEVIDSEFIGNNGDVAVGAGGYSTGRNAEVTLRNSCWRSEWYHGNTGEGSVHGESAGTPTERIPAGCPTSPEEAAAGEGSDGGSGPYLPEGDFELAFETNGDLAEYLVELDADSVEPGDDANTHEHEYQDRAFESGGNWYVHGYVGSGGTDNFHVENGEVLRVGQLQESTRITANGRRLDLEAFDTITSATDEDAALENTLVVNGSGTSGVTNYEFTVSGDVEKATLQGASIDEEDTIENGTVTGTIAGWLDAFRFSGELEELNVDGQATVLVNDERIDPAEYGEEFPHTLTIVGRGVPSSYEATVEGDLQTSNDDVTVSSNTAEGTIHSEVHRIQFSGVLTDITFIDGNAHVYLDDEQIDPEEYGDQPLLPHALVIDGSESTGPSTYSFTIDGAVTKSEYRNALIDSEDLIEGETVSGVVDDELDAYWFDGDIDDFSLLGDATVDVEYNVRDR